MSRDSANLAYLRGEVTECSLLDSQYTNYELDVTVFIFVGGLTGLLFPATNRRNKKFKQRKTNTTYLWFLVFYNHAPNTQLLCNQNILYIQKYAIENYTEIYVCRRKTTPKNSYKNKTATES